jgi:hypothetical protein
VPPELAKNKNEETATIQAIFDTGALYGTVVASREVTVYRQ